MNIKGIDWLKGYVTCQLRGRYIELFINSINSNRLDVWNIQMISENVAKCNVSLQDFFKLKSILKKTYTRIHVIDRIGLPFIIARLFKRKGIMIGLFLFILIFYLFSSMIWSINVQGNKTIKNEVIYQTIDEIGIHKGMFKYKLPDQKELQEYLRSKLEDTAWVGVSIKGIQLNITVVEKVSPDKSSNIGPRHIVSAKNAIVHKILAEKGTSLVKVNDRVKKGDILISGIIGSEENNKLVAATGTVEGIVWYQTEVTLPLKHKWKEYTGNSVERKYIGTGEKMVKYKGFKDIPFSNYQKTYSWKHLNWGKYQLPVVFITEKILEYREREEILTVKEAYKLATEQAKRDLLTKIDVDSKVLSEKILQQSNQNGKVTIKMLYEVLEDITTTQPINQGE